jgi:hypothetical protein
MFFRTIVIGSGLSHEQPQHPVDAVRHDDAPDSEADQRQQQFMPYSITQIPAKKSRYEETERNIEANSKKGHKNPLFPH